MKVRVRGKVAHRATRRAPPRLRTCAAGVTAPCMFRKHRHTSSFAVKWLARRRRSLVVVHEIAGCWWMCLMELRKGRRIRVRHSDWVKMGNGATVAARVFHEAKKLLLLADRIGYERALFTMGDGRDP